MRSVKLNHWGLGLLLALAIVASTGVAFADGGVTFTNVAGSTGITYERFPTPAREADQQAFYAAGLPFPPGVTFNILAETPQKPRGAPGVIVLDYDNDGDQDIYVTNGPGHANSLYQNQLVPGGSLGFVDVAAAAGVEATAQDSTGVCYGDIDNDGNEDIYVLGTGMMNILYRSNGNGTFSNITAAAGVGGGTFNHTGCALADFNGDGLLDIAVGNSYTDWLQRHPVFLPEYDGVQPNLLFLRRGDLPGIQFQDVSATSGIRNLGPYANLNGASYTWAIAAVDYDQDGDVDIQWADTNGPPPGVSPTDDRGWIRTLQNDGAGNFTDVSQAAGTNKTGSWMGLSYGDFNCDGAIDFFCTNLGQYVGGPQNQSRAFFGNGSGGFTDPGVGPFFSASVFGWGTSVLDYDNDGDQDIFYYGDDDLLNLIALDNKGTVLQNQSSCTGQFKYDLGALLTDHRLREVNGVAQGDVNNDGWQDMVTVAMVRFNPIPSRVLPFTLVTGPLDPILDPITKVLLVMARTTADLTKLILLPGFDAPNGDLAVEVNSGGNGNNSVEFKTLGTKGIISGGKNNRDGIGAVVKFTPAGGASSLAPVMGGGSHASQDSRIMHFGLGTATSGTVEVKWPGGVKNIFFDVAAGEKLLLPEIPCSFDPAAWKNFGLFNACLTQATNNLRKAGVLTEAQEERLRASGRRVFGR